MPITRRAETSNPAPLAIITGASSGIGRAIATRLAQHGYRTILIARRAELLNELAAQLTPHAPSIPVVLDLAGLDAIAPTMARLLEAHGPPTVLVNNAGYGIYAPFLDTSPAERRALMQVNFDAACELTRAALPTLLRHAKQGGGECHVFNICSMSARVGPWGHSAYAASKGAMKSLTEVLHAEHARDGVRFTTVYPGVIRTPYFEKGSMVRLWPKVASRAVSAERVAAAVVKAIGSKRVSLYVPAFYRVLDVVTTVSPRLGQWMVRMGSEVK